MIQISTFFFDNRIILRRYGVVGLLKYVSVDQVLKIENFVGIFALKLFHIFSCSSFGTLHRSLCGQNILVFDVIL